MNGGIFGYREVIEEVDGCDGYLTCLNSGFSRCRFTIPPCNSGSQFVNILIEEVEN
ncbi:MAG: hypothetical protein ACK4EX_01005 [Thermaurantimonas sp.]|uniref:hypothetical protein n=1 Tax=Thermaurantimonas sp. TaxID=2681568 RepID=UPI00391A45E3